MNLRNLTDRAQQLVAAVLAEGGLAVDATAGNGHDTLFLATAVGDTGRVISIDCQESAILETENRLMMASLRHRVDLRLARHEDWDSLLPPDWRCRIQAVMFNLGYLPGGDKRITTHPESTQAALQAAAAWLAPGGMISVLVYRGHDGGLDESRAVHGWAKSLPPNEWDALHITVSNAPDSSPELLLLCRRTPAG
jgi:predicted methyltransferase